MQISHKNNNMAGWCKGSTTDFDSVDCRSTRHPATILRRAAAGVASVLMLALLLLPAFVSPVSAALSQGNLYWYVSDIVDFEDEEYYIISLFSDGALYPTDCQWLVYIQPEHADSVHPIGTASGYSVEVYHETVCPFYQLEIPRNGFYLDDDWVVDLRVSNVSVLYQGQDAGISERDTYFTLVDPSVMPTQYLEVSGGTIASSPLISKVYPFYIMDEGQEVFVNGGVWLADVYPQYVSTMYQGFNYPVYSASSTGVTTVVSQEFRMRSFEGFNVSELVPVPYFNPLSVTRGVWYTVSAQLSLQYLCPTSKLESYSVGDLFPHDALYNIDQILQGLEDGEIEYIQAMEDYFNISKNDVIDKGDALDEWLSSSDEIFGAFAYEDLSVEFGEAFGADLNFFAEILLMFLAFGIVFIFVRKGVS